MVQPKELLHLYELYMDLRFSDREKFFDPSEPNPVFGVQDQFEQGHVQGFFTYNEVTNTTYLIMIGSNEIVDWFYNFWFFKKVTPYKESWTSQKIKVHNGFYQSYLLVRDQVHARIENIVIPKKSKMVIMGHSFGGALAVLTALDLQYNFPELEIDCLSGGAPRVGNEAFKESYDKRVPETLRLVNGSDLVTKVPFTTFGFRHIGHRLWIHPRFFISVKDHYPLQYYRRLRERIT